MTVDADTQPKPVSNFPSKVLGEPAVLYMDGVLWTYKHFSWDSESMIANIDGIEHKVHDWDTRRSDDGNGIITDLKLDDGATLEIVVN